MQHLFPFNMPGYAINHTPNEGMYRRVAQSVRGYGNGGLSIDDPSA